MRTRFAPSPTGFLHVGGLRTALYSYLLSKQNDGNFLLRIEDTDRERYVEGGVENILNSLYWARISPDEGVVLEAGKVAQKGRNGPYIQSERLSLYHKYSKQLIEDGNAYYCFCTQERLEVLRKDQEKRKQPTGYDQHCLKNISHEEAEKKLAAGEKHVVRLKMPKTGETAFDDLIRGKVVFKNALIDDQVLVKSDGYPTYHLAVVVDDHLMEITHVVRGEEWISSTPKHIQIYKYLGWEPPKFAHLPLLLNPDKSKLSKRQGDVAVSDYEAKGYLPEALVNFVAFLGWNPGDNREIFSIDELIKEFKIEKINKTGAVFNIDKLNWFNKEYIKKLSDNELIRRALPYFLRENFYAGFGSKIQNESWFIKVLKLEKERVTTLSEFPDALKFIFEVPDYDKDVLIWRKGSPEEALQILSDLLLVIEAFVETEWNKSNLESKIMEWIKEGGFGTGNVLWPFRVSLSGQQNSPGPFEIAEVLGKPDTIDRVKKAIHKLK